MTRQSPLPHRKFLGLPPFARRRQPSAVKVLETPRKYGCLLAVLPLGLRKQFTDWALENVPDFHLGPGGRELRPHVTVKWGFTEPAEEVLPRLREFLAARPPLQARLTGLNLFAAGYGKWQNEDGDVLYAEVESPDLHRLNAEISQVFDCHDTYPEYRPHVTVAYLDPAVSQSYLKGAPPFLPCTVVLDQLEWSGADHRAEAIPLGVLPRFGTKGIVLKRDRLQRKICYDDQTGKRVPCPKTGKAPEARQASRERPPPQVAVEQGQRQVNWRQVVELLESAEVTGWKPLGGGMSSSFVVKFGDTHAVFKPGAGEPYLRSNIPQGTYYKREAAAARVAEILGVDDLVPPAVVRSIDGEEGSVQAFVPGAQDAMDVPLADKYNGPEDLLRAAAFDFVLASSDRHGGNWLLKDGKLVLIDNGLAFPEGQQSFLDYMVTFFRTDVVRGVGRSDLLKQALSKPIPPEIRGWASKADQVGAALAEHGLSAAADLTIRRMALLADPQYRTFGDLVEAAIRLT